MVWRLRYGKFNNKKTKFQGSTFQSKGEADYARELEFRKKAGDIRDYSSQVPIDLFVGEQKITRYYADFIIEHNDGTREVVEYKGFFTDYAKLKWKLFCAIYEKEHPDIKITMIKHRSYWHG